MLSYKYTAPKKRKVKNPIMMTEYIYGFLFYFPKTLFPVVSVKMLLTILSLLFTVTGNETGALTPHAV